MSPRPPPVTTANDWDTMGLKFDLIPEERYDEVCEFLHNNYCPDEPVTRSLGLCRPGTLFHRLVHEEHFKSCLREGRSLMVVDRNSRLLGVQLGRKITRSSNKSSSRIVKWISVFQWMLPQVE